MCRKNFQSEEFMSNQLLGYVPTLLHSFNIRHINDSNVNFPDMRQDGDHLEYLFLQKDGMPSQRFPSAEAFRKWPRLVITYLENHINIHSGDKRDTFVSEEAANTIGNPIKISCAYL